MLVKVDLFSVIASSVYVVMILTGNNKKKKQKDPGRMGLTVMCADKGTFKGTEIILMRIFLAHSLG